MDNKNCEENSRSGKELAFAAQPHMGQPIAAPNGAGDDWQKYRLF
jgi:hypothetical protein